MARLTNEDCDRGHAHERANDNAEAVRAVGKCAAWEVVLGIHKAYQSTGLPREVHPGWKGTVLGIYIRRSDDGSYCSSG